MKFYMFFLVLIALVTVLFSTKFYFFVGIPVGILTWSWINYNFNRFMLNIHIEKEEFEIVNKILFSLNFLLPIMVIGLILPFISYPFMKKYSTEFGERLHFGFRFKAFK